MGKILEVKNLKISFRTNSGILRAVRNISFDLEKGETLAIVGESGSGKSVTSKAVLGILAGNSIVDSGEILYDGKDLLKIPESEMYKIRGDKISMIFQDPLSSLNPIVKIGKQITEAMLLKNKAARKTAKKEFNALLKELKTNIIAAVSEDGSATPEHVEEMAKEFDKFNVISLKLENSYNESHAKALELYADIEDFLFRISKHQKADIRSVIKEYNKTLLQVTDKFLIKDYELPLSDYSELLKAENLTAVRGQVDSISESLTDLLRRIQKTLGEITERTRPDFFRIGYYAMKNPEEDIYSYDVDNLNEKALTYLNDNFMNEFIDLTVKGVTYSYNRALNVKKQVITELKSAKEYYSSADLQKQEATAKAKALSDVVEESIDKLETVKDSVAYTFRSSLSEQINKYFFYKKNNPKEEARFEKQSRKRDKLIAAGKRVDWKVVPKNVYSLELQSGNIISVIDRLSGKYEEYIEQSGKIDFTARAIALIDFFKDKASQAVYKVTPKMAKEKAIKLMDEVGIAESRIRFYQYPFEFSGGMRQRIVIAIALAANPDILICDEPTTALDVTIQAQILELINNLKKERNLSVIFITHDLGVVANMADKIAVMYAGKIVEYGTADDIFYDPRHPYTWALLSSMPDLDTNEKLEAIPGTPPNMIYPPKGDAFADRNKYALKIDYEQEPPFFKISDTHVAATWLLHPSAPKVEMPKIISERIARAKARMEGDVNGK